MSQRTKLILYVGRAVAADRALQLSLAEMNPDWGAIYAGTARDALGMLSQSRIDAVVSDTSLPDLDGMEFLNKVQAHDSRIRRLAVFDVTQRDAALKFAGAAHHLVPTPWSAGTLRAALERTFQLGFLLSNERVRELMRRLKRVPSPPDLYFKIAKILRSPTAELDDVARLVVHDLAITAKLLQLTNSAALGLRSRATTVHQAIQFLGLETTRSLVLLAHTFSYCDQTRVAGFSLEQLWEHSVVVGSVARDIAKAEGAPAEVAEESFLAGLLHDMGKLLFAVNLPDEYATALRAARAEGKPVWQAELDKFDVTHAEAGAELLATWNFPLPVVEALALHHHPTRLSSMEVAPLTAVHAANALVHEIAENQAPSLEMDYLKDLGLEGRIAVWRDLAAKRIYAEKDEDF